VIGRASAFWTNPNKAAESVLLLCLLAFARSSPVRRMCLLFAAVTAILLTFSRGALFSWAVFVIIATWLRMVPLAALALPLVLLIALPWISSFFQSHVVGWLEIEAGAANVIDRIEGIVKLELGDDATSERLTALDHAIEAFMDAPIFGAGIGWLEGQHDVGAHNELLLVAAEYGIAGVVLLFILFHLVWRGNLVDPSRAYRLLALAVVASLSMFTHNMLEFPYWLLALALLTSIGADGAAEQR
jgi:O-antigen ligase